MIIHMAFAMIFNMVFEERSVCFLKLLFGDYRVSGWFFFIFLLMT